MILNCGFIFVMVQVTAQKYIKLLILVIRSTMQDILVFFIPPFFEPLSFSCPLSSLKNLEQAARAQAETTKYCMRKFPTLSFICSQVMQSNPFSFLHPPHNQRSQIIGEMLQSLIPLRPQCKPVSTLFPTSSKLLS